MQEDTFTVNPNLAKLYGLTSLSWAIGLTLADALTELGLPFGWIIGREGLFLFVRFLMIWAVGFLARWAIGFVLARREREWLTIEVTPTTIAGPTASWIHRERDLILRDSLISGRHRLWRDYLLQQRVFQSREGINILLRETAYNVSDIRKIQEWVDRGVS